MKRVQIPGNLDVPMRLFGRFTIRDLLRLSLPIIPGLLRQSWLIALIGIGVGTLLYFVRPYKQPLDTHIYNCVRWVAMRGQIEGSDIGEFEDDGWGHGIDSSKIKSQTGNLIAVIKVQPTNLDLKTEAEQQALHNIYQDLLRTVNYPLEIHSRQRPLSLDQYLQELKTCNSNDKGLKTDYLRFCSEFEDEDLTLTDHYIVINAEENGLNYLWRLVQRLLDNDPESADNALDSELDSRCREVIGAIDSTDLSARRLTGDDLEQFADSVNYPTEETTLHCSVQDEYRRAIEITEYPSTTELAWPLQLLRVDGKVDVVQKVEPMSSGETSDRLQRLSEKLNAEINSLLSGGHRGTNKFESLLEDTEWFLDLLADRQAKPVEYSSCVTVHSPDKGRTEDTLAAVCNRLDTLGFEYRHPVLRADLGYRSDSPLYRDGLDNELLMPASSAAAGFPFATQNSGEAGIVYGTDTYDGTPILLDRFSWSSHSMARMGMVGSGKSYATKIELLRAALVYDDLQIIVVDPKQEYGRVISMLGGSTRELDGGDYSLDNDYICLTVSERGQSENIGLLTDAVEQIYREVSQDQRRTLVLVDEARNLLNDEDGRRILNRFVLEGRDTNTAITLVTQNASHFTYCREGREILDNMPGKVFMRHDRVPDSVVDYFDFSAREKQELFELKTGTDADYSEALLRVSGRISTRVTVESTSQEHALIENREK